jgi:hypothetical protein
VGDRRRRSGQIAARDAHGVAIGAAEDFDESGLAGALNLDQVVPAVAANFQCRARGAGA